jgi:hypothetical protein
MSWQERAQRALRVLDGDPDGNAERSRRIYNHVLNESNRDEYISRDFFNVQQTAGGLPEGMTFDDFLRLVAGHVRQELEGSGSFADEVGDADFRTAALSIDESIRRHISFLNGVVHQGAPGEAHLQLWDFILRSRDDDASVYSCYRDFLVDA